MKTESDFPQETVRNNEALPRVLNDEERDLIRRLRAGDNDAFEALVHNYGDRMLAVARRFLPVEQDARDVVQEALLSVFRAIHNFCGDARLSTWLHSIVVNAALMQLRSRRRHREESIDDLMLPRFDNRGNWLNGEPRLMNLPDLSLERRDIHEVVRKCIARLPDSYRTVLLMRDIEELDTDEVARILGASVNAIKVRLHRARQALRTTIGHELRASGESLAET